MKIARLALPPAGLRGFEPLRFRQARQGLKKN
jgi:hypothetical protein